MATPSSDSFCCQDCEIRALRSIIADQKRTASVLKSELGRTRKTANKLAEALRKRMNGNDDEAHLRGLLNNAEAQARAANLALSRTRDELSAVKDARSKEASAREKAEARARDLESQVERLTELKKQQAKSPRKQAKEFKKAAHAAAREASKLREKINVLGEKSKSKDKKLEAQARTIYEIQERQFLEKRPEISARRLRENPEKYLAELEWKCIRKKSHIVYKHERYGTFVISASPSTNRIGNYRKTALRKRMTTLESL